MVDNTSIPTASNTPDKPLEAVLKPITEEKVEVLIKELLLISPRDFSAFKHALEDFVQGWDK